MNGHGLKHISFSELDEKLQRTYCYKKIAAILADYGLFFFRQSTDRHGADFVSTGVKGEVLKIKFISSNFKLSKNYLDYKDLWVIFYCGENWYLIKYKELVMKVGEATNLLNKSSKNHGTYTISDAIPHKFEKLLEGYKIKAL